jgi:RNA polymerase sigma-70 factor (ECF subfamily)
MTGLERYGSIENAIRAVASGDRLALRAIYDAEGARLNGIAFRMLKRRAAAEDVVQDTFLKLWEAAGSFDGRAGYGRAWLTTMLRNRTLNVLRGEARTDLVDDFEPLGFESDGESAEDRLARLSDESALKRCLEGLDAARRRLIVLAFTEGLSHGEIAAKLGTPLGTVKSWLRRSLLSLRECMG